MTADPVSKIDILIRPNSNPKIPYNQFWAIKIIILQASIPTQIRIKEVITNAFASSSLFSEKYFPMKRCTPVGIPKLATTDLLQQKKPEWSLYQLFQWLLSST
jgi:hypothetical protein